MPKTRKHRQKQQKQRGGINRRVTFSNNTKPPNANNTNHSHLPNTYLNELRNMLPSSNPVHGENAHIFAKVTGAYTNPDKMAKDFFYMYYPSPLSTRDYTLLIDLVHDSSIPYNQKDRIIKHMRYERALTKLRKSYAPGKNEVNATFNDS